MIAILLNIKIINYIHFLFIIQISENLSLKFKKTVKRYKLEEKLLKI